MIVILAALIGAAAGWRRARALGGDRRDMAQYMAVFAIAGAVLGLFATLMIDRSL